MDLRVFEKSPGVAPLLVKLYESQKLFSAARGTEPGARAELTGAVADLLEIDLSPREQELLTDVLTGLMRQAEMDLRQALAERLAAIGTIPLRLALQLANDEIPVAAPILRSSPVLSDLDLVYIIKARGPAYWQAIAERPTLSPQLIDILADTRDVGTAVKLSANDRICLTWHAAQELMNISRGNETVARSLLARRELPENLMQELYAQAGRDLKAGLQGMKELAGADVAGELDDVMKEFAQPAPDPEFMPDAGMFEMADRYKLTGMLNIHVMLDTLQQGHLPAFIAMFSRFTDIPARRICNFLKQPCPKGMAIACKAYGIAKPEFSRIYLMTNRMRSQERIVNQKDMLDILHYFEKIKADSARRLIHNELGAWEA